MTRRPKFKNEKQPRQDMATVGNDVVERARLRFGRPQEADAAPVDQHSDDCVICQFQPAYNSTWRRTTVGGNDVAVCDRCSSLAVSVIDYRPDLRVCLVILAMNVERAAAGHDGPGGVWFFPETDIQVNTAGIGWRIARNFKTGLYASLCNCPAHVNAREPDAFRKQGFTQPLPGVPDVTGLSLDILRTFPEKVMYQGEVISRNWLTAKLEREYVEPGKRAKPIKGGVLAKAHRKATKHPGVVPGGLSDCALKAATLANAAMWQEVHEWERENDKQHPGLAVERKPAPIVLDDADVELLNQAFSREADDARFYCDCCGDFEAVMRTPTGVFICPSCRCDSRVQRLMPIMDAVRQGKPVKWLDHIGNRNG